MDKNLLRAQLLMEAADLLAEETYEDFEELDEDTRWTKEGKKQLINRAKEFKTNFNKKLNGFKKDDVEKKIDYSELERAINSCDNVFSFDSVFNK